MRGSPSHLDRIKKRKERKKEKKKEGQVASGEERRTREGSFPRGIGFGG